MLNLNFEAIFQAIRIVIIKTRMLNVTIPPKPNCENGEEKRIKRGLPQWCNNKTGFSQDALEMK